MADFHGDTAVSEPADGLGGADGLTRWERPPERSFWDCLSGVERADLRRSAGEETFSPGTVIYAEGEISAHVTIVVKGWVKVAVRAGSAEKIVAIRGPGDVVGEMAGLWGRPRSATVTCVDSVRALVVPGEEFLAFLRRNLPARHALIHQVAQRAAEGGTRMLSYGSASGERRLAALILEQAVRRGRQTKDHALTVTLPLSYEDLADWADTSTDDVERSVAEWHSRGAVTAARNRITVVDANELDRISGHLAGTLGPGLEADRRSSDPMRCSIFLTEIVGFAGHDERTQGLIRERHYRILQQVFDAAEVPWMLSYVEDRGDGVLILVPAIISPAQLVGPLLAHLTTALRSHNREFPQVPVRLRVAFHVGDIYRDRFGLSGSPLIQAARLLEAPALREPVDDPADPADLAYITSAEVHESVVRAAGSGLDPADFVSTEVSVREFTGTGWVYRPPGGATPAPLVDPAGAGDEIEARSRKASRKVLLDAFLTGLVTVLDVFGVVQPPRRRRDPVRVVAERISRVEERLGDVAAASRGVHGPT